MADSRKKQSLQKLQEVLWEIGKKKTGEGVQNSLEQNRTALEQVVGQVVREKIGQWIWIKGRE